LYLLPMRILILGLPGSGKSTFARKLSRQLNLPHIEADEYFWKPGANFLEEIKTQVAQQSWIYEGHFNKVRAIVAPQVTHVFWLNLPYPLILFRWLMRSLRTFDFGDWKWVIRDRKALEKTYAEAIHELAHQGAHPEIITSTRQERALCGDESLQVRFETIAPKT
jgi:adenylate kinase family enzyme